MKYLLGFDNVKNYDGSWTEWGNLVGARCRETVKARAVKTRRLLAPSAGARRLGGHDRNLQAGRGVSLHDRQRRSRRALRPRRRDDEGRGRVAGDREGDPLPGADAKVRSLNARMPAVSGLPLALIIFAAGTHRRQPRRAARARRRRVPRSVPQPRPRVSLQRRGRDQPDDGDRDVEHGVGRPRRQTADQHEARDAARSGDRRRQLSRRRHGAVRLAVAAAAAVRLRRGHRRA